MSKERGYASLTARQVAELLAQPKNTVIMLHTRPDGDAVGSAVALKLLLEALGSRAVCVCANEVPHREAFLLDGVQDSLLESAIPTDLTVERVVAVDTASPAQMGTLADAWLDRVDVMIDHHGTGTPYADGWIEPAASATGEMIFMLSRLWLSDGAVKAIPMRAEEAMFTAIASDTGGFRYSNVTPTTHLCAAELIRAGVDTASINHRLFECKPYELMRAEQVGFAAMRRYFDGRVTVVPMTYAMKTEHGLGDGVMDTLVDVARMVEGTELAISIRQMTDEGRFRVSTRSNGAFRAAALCAAFGGGGHEKAAGCTVEADTVDSVIEQLLAVIARLGI